MNTERSSMPKCPHCGHEFDHDDMMSVSEDLYAAAPDEITLEVRCPIANCDKDFWVQGGYTPHYDCSKEEP